VLRELFGETLLLIGAGHIGREVESRAKAFGMRVLLARRGDPWRDWLSGIDWLVPTCPLTPETTGLIGAAEFARMKSTARLVNITRGRVVDEQAAYEALRDRRIAGAALDVWYRYPTQPDDECLPSQYPFHELDNVLLSPHNSGWTNRTIMGRVEDIADNIARLRRGEPLGNRLR
jgi:phosphoglycerate dehydrogenase-like enzyme